MKFYLIYAIVFVLLLQGAASAQQTAISLSKDNSPCPNYPMPVIKPLVDDDKSPIIKPENKIDYKLIIVNPCLLKTEQSQTSSSLAFPNDENDLQPTTTKFKLDEDVFIFTPSKNVRQNFFLFPKQHQ